MHKNETIEPDSRLKICSIRILQLDGIIETNGPFWEERLMRPLDFYAEFRGEPPREGGVQKAESGFHLSQLFLEIEANDGHVGIAGPLWKAPARIILDELAPLLIDRDPLATEFIWDIMHRSQAHGRQGYGMIAISAVDCALWDLKGKCLGQPVWRLLGGKTRDSVPAYASMLGYSVDDEEQVHTRAKAFKQEGFEGQKWFFRHTPAEGIDGMNKNVALVRAVREAVGDDYPIMFDAWQSLTYEYAVELCRRIAPYQPSWLEEPFLPDRIDVHARLKQKTSIPLSGAEHEYTRWGMLRFFEKQALDIYQPDIYWCGGISEIMKIAALASVHDVTLIPHGHSIPAGIHFSAAQSPAQVPLIEYLAKWNEINMHFLKDAPWPQMGRIFTPEKAGLGMHIDEEKVLANRSFTL